MQEEWKELSGLDGLPVLLVSNLGNVYNKATERRCKFYNCKGYRITSIRFKGKRKCVKAHRLVAMAFIPNPDNLPEVNHKNGIKSDNRVENLEWCTRSQNAKHAYKLGLNHASGGVPPKPVLCVELGLVFPSVSSASRFFGKVSNRQRVCLSARDSRYRAYGYHWKYLNKEANM
jgi:hypothetical protein